jgi:hypothetical protein
MAEQDWYHCAFGGYVTEMFNDKGEAKIEIFTCSVLPRGTIVTALKENFAAQSFQTGLKRGDYVEGNVFKTGDNNEPYRFKHVTKII